MFNLFKCTVVIDKLVFTSAILVFVFCMYYIFSSFLNRGPESAGNESLGLLRSFLGMHTALDNECGRLDSQEYIEAFQSSQ